MSLIEQPSARLTALTSGSFSGSHQATRFDAGRLALEAGRAVARHEEQIGELARHPDPVAQVA